MLSTSYVLTDSFNPPILWSVCSRCPHFTDEEIEAQRSYTMCPGSHSWELSCFSKERLSKGDSHSTLGLELYIGGRGGRSLRWEPGPASPIFSHRSRGLGIGPSPVLLPVTGG